MSDLLSQVQAIFRDVFDDQSLEITRNSNATSVEDWDSLAHVNLITALEQRYKIRFGLGELQDMKSVGDMMDLLDKKLAAKSASRSKEL